VSGRASGVKIVKMEEMGAPISLDGWQSIRIIGALPGTTLLIYPGYPVAWL